MNFFILIHVLITFLPSVHGQDAALSSSNNTTAFSNLFWQLHDLEGQRPKGNPYLGGQNFSWCCLKAFENALDVENGTVVIRNNSRSTIGANNIDELLNAAARGQFPCGARYNGDPRGAAVVAISYDFLVEQCPGWELSSWDNVNAWLHSLSGFLLPAVIFCLSVPRRRKLYIPRSFFTPDLAGIKSHVPAFLGALAAGLIVLLDTTIWLSICFAFAGPMILSGLYEAMIDSRVLEFLREKIQNKRLTLDMRCRCLMLILIGNLDLALESDSTPTQHDSTPSQRDSISHQHNSTPGQHDSNPSQHDSTPDQHDSNLNQHDSNPSQHDSTLDQHDSSLNQHDYTPSQRDSNPSRRSSTSRPLSQPATSPVSPGTATGTLGVTNGPLPPDNTSDIPNNEILILTKPATPDNPEPASSTMTPRQPQNLAPNMQSPRAGTIASSTLTIRRMSTAPTVRRTSTAHMAASPWRHMEVLLYGLRLYDDDNSNRNESPRQYARHICEDSRNCDDSQHMEQSWVWAAETNREIMQTKTRLRSMLHCQYSFGTLIGAPVVFFLGGFIFAFLSSLDHIGDEYIGESIAFGAWYMIIPHMAIVSGLLLAGNNPNILEGVFATEREDQADSDTITFGLFRFELVYPSCYKVAWQWQRGHNKKRWIDQLLQTYSRRDDADDDDDLENLRAKTNLSSLDWFLLLSLTLLLLGVPFVLAFLTSFFTPQIGLSCRSGTFALSFCVQVGQIGLWLWAYAGPPAALVEETTGSARARRRGFHPLNFFRKGGWLDGKGFYTPSSVDWLLRSQRERTGSVWDDVQWSELWSFNAVWCGIYYFLVTVFGLAAIFSSIGGTLMQIIGVYRNAICYINTPYWLAPIDQKPMAVLSTNSAEMIRNSIKHWEPCALTAILFMACVSFIAWWYQRRTRGIFRQLVHDIDNPRFDREDTRSARRHMERELKPGAGR